MNPSDATRITHEAYDATASRYYDRWHHFDPLVSTKQRFARLLPSGARLLDAGCGTGRDLAWFLGAGFQGVGVDRSLAMLQIARNHGPCIQADVRQLPLRSGFVDGWWASASLLHLTREDLGIALDELRRVSKQDAVGYLSLKEGRGDGLEPVGGGSHRRYFCYWVAEDLDDALASAGWSAKEAWTEDDALGRHPWVSRIVRTS